jgi:hypothetical protein
MVLFKQLAAIFLIVKACIGISVAQDIKDGMGKTFYDPEKKQVKEIYHYILNYSFLRDPITNEILKDTTIMVKNGPYLQYHKNGKLAVSGSYKNNQKAGTWKTYNSKGELINIENF